MSYFFRIVTLACCAVAGGLVPASAQERPYFVTYDHYLEERGNLELAVASTTGIPRKGYSVYTAPWIEVELGVTGWWTAELYLEGVTTRKDGNGFTGWRREATIEWPENLSGSEAQRLILARPKSRPLISRPIQCHSNSTIPT